MREIKEQAHREININTSHVYTNNNDMIYPEYLYATLKHVRII